MKLSRASPLFLQSPHDTSQLCPFSQQTVSPIAQDLTFPDLPQKTMGYWPLLTSSGDRELPKAGRGLILLSLIPSVSKKQGHGGKVFKVGTVLQQSLREGRGPGPVWRVGLRKAGRDISLWAWGLCKTCPSHSHGSLSSALITPHKELLLRTLCPRHPQPMEQCRPWCSSLSPALTWS